MSTAVGKLPSRNIGPWAAEIIKECQHSRDSRRQESAYWRNLFFTGTNDGKIKSKHNRCFSLVDTLSSYLFSPADLKFDIQFDSDETEDWEDCADVAARHLNREFNRRRCGVTFAQGVDVALVEGAAFAKAVWGRGGLEPHLIRPQFMSVLREDIPDLDRQDAFVHSFYLTESQFGRLIFNKSDKAEIMGRIRNAFDAKAEDELAPNYMHEIIVGGIYPLQNNPPSQTMGKVDAWGPPTPSLSPEVAKRLIRVDDLWVMDDKRDDWTTIRYVQPDIVVEGEEIHRNLSDIPHEQPFVKICPNEQPDYFWGRSELANVQELQMLLNARIENVDHIFRRQARPSAAFVGFSGINDEKMRAMLSPDGMYSESTPGAKIESLAPTMPSIAMEYLALLDSYFNDAAGLTPILSGHGESGVRAGVHANTLLRTSSPRLKDRALLVEGQAASYGDLWFKMLQAKNADNFKTRKGKEFLLQNLPKDATVTVDSHTSSPAFSDANQALIFALAKAGIVQGDSVIQTTHPPQEDKLLDRWYKMKAEEAQLIKEHPEILTKGRGRR